MRRPLLPWVAVGLLWFGAAEASAGTKTVVKGKLVYGPVIETAERATDDASAAVFSRGLAQGEPIPDVTVALRNGWLAYEGEGEVVTGPDGTFSITVDGTPSTLILVVKAKNDYVKVRKFGKGIVGCVNVDDVLKTETEVGSKLKLEGGTEDLHAITVVDDRSDTYEVDGVVNYISRGFYICKAAQISAENIRSLTGKTLPSVNVRLGLVKLIDLDLGSIVVDLTTGSAAGEMFEWFFPDSILSWPPSDKATAFYWQGCDTIYLNATEAETFYHEYGHFIEDKLAAFALVPCYFSHGACQQMETTFTDTPNLCWAWLEGLATWLGAINSVSAYGWPTDLTPAIDVNQDGKTNTTDAYLLTLGYAYLIETSVCSDSEASSWSDRRAVESVVANVLWDLIDPNEETAGTTVRVPEIAQARMQDILEVIMKPLSELKDETGLKLDHNPCGFFELNAKLMGLDQFWAAWRAVHPGPVPDLYAAYSHNGVDYDDAADVDGPKPLTITSSTHEKSVWSRNSEAAFTVTDGDDDVSGSYYYGFAVTESHDSAGIGIPTDCTAADKCSGETSFVHEQHLEDGDSWYFHVRSRDLAGNWDAGEAVFGPIQVDTTAPYWIPADRTFAVAERYVIGTYVHFDWEAGDALSGVSRVEILYSDPDNGITGLPSLTFYSAKGSADYYLDPDRVRPTTAGYFTLNVYDVAGNPLSSRTDDLTVVSPFEGPNELGLAPDQGRVVCGDLDGDGKDEIVLSGQTSGGRILKIIQVSPALTVQDLTPGLAGGDLFLADIDRDGDLDLVAAGDFGGASPEIYLFRNEGAAGFTSLGALSLPTFSDMVVRVVDLYGTGEPILVYGGKIGAGAPNQQLRAYHLQLGGPVELLSGTFFRGGDFEVGDINADGILDFVTLSYDAAGDGRIQTFLGQSQENTFSWSAGRGTAVLYPEIGDVDLGNWDSDNDLEFFAMYQSTSPGDPENHSELWEWTGPGYDLANGAGGVNRIAQGDGHIVDIYNDGLPDVFALGRTASGGLSSWYVTNEKLGRRSSGVPYPVRVNGLYDTDTAWGDFDNDGDLDVVVVGTTAAGLRRAVWYENKMSVYSKPNADPPAPINLQSTYDAARGGYVLSWEAPGLNTDETVEAAFEYEIRVGTTAGASDVVSWAHPAGRGQQVAPAYAGGRLQRFVPMSAGALDWCVRTIDSGWRRSGCNTVNAGAFASVLPAGTSAAGTTPPVVAGGALHLTDPILNQSNYWITPMPLRAVQAVRARWKTYIGGGGPTNVGTAGGRGLSFNLGADLGTSFSPDAGAANGLSARIDTFDDGGFEVGLEIKWNGLPVAFARSADGGNTAAAKAPLRPGQFLDTTLTVTPDGTVTFSYAGLTASGALPGYDGIVANEYVFAAATGTATDSHWIDDLTVHFGESSGSDLKATFGALPPSITEGDVFPMSLLASNAGPSTATAMELLANLPSGLSIQSATASQGSCEVDGTEIRCSLGSLGAGRTAAVQLLLEAGTLAAGSPESVSLSNLTCLVSAAGSDPNEADNRATLPVVILARRDFGDAPGATYPTCLPGGARHRLLADGVYCLGTVIDGEPDCQPDDNAAGRADEDGVAFAPPPPWSPGTVVTPTVFVTRPAAMSAVLDAWFDRDGVPGFGPADRIYSAAALPAIGPNVLPPFTVPATVPAGSAWLRFRLSETGVAAPGGYAASGEVEDYPVEIVPPPIPPTVALLSPVEGSSLSVGTPVTLSATATAAGGSEVAAVFFYDESREVGSAMASPSTISVAGLAGGVHTITAVAYDKDGLAATSAPVHFTLTGESGILREWFLGITGTDIWSLTNAPAFPDHPSGSAVEPLFEGPRGFADNYGTRLRGYVTPPITGAYTFWVAGDDEAMLFLSTDDTPARRVMIGRLDSGSGFREWDRDPAQQSIPVTLQAGRRYYIEALQKDGSGDDHISVGWQLPDGTLERPIPGNRLNPWIVPAQPDLGISLSLAPRNLTENIAATLTLNVSNQAVFPASNVQLSVQAPAGLRLQTATPSAGACQILDSGLVVCSVASLPGDSMFKVDLAIRPNFLPSTSELLVNLGNLTAAASATETDLNAADNTLTIPIAVQAQTDWGDARGGFPVTAAEDGAYHRYSPAAPWLGPRWDNDGFGNHSPLADFDDTHGATDDEDGVIFPAPLVAGTTATVLVICANAPGFLDAWADFNANTNWTDENEQIFARQSLSVGTNTLSFPVPAGAGPGAITTRWRLSTDGGLSVTGYGGVGEVEDHLVQVEASGPADLEVRLQGLPIEAEIADQPFRYAAILSNLGSSAADNVSLVLSHEGVAVSGLQVSASGSSCQVNGGQINCSLSSLAPGQSTRVVVTVTPQGQGKLVVHAVTTGPNPELGLDNNAAAGLVPVISPVASCACSCSTNGPPPSPHPLLTSWFTDGSGRYARIVRRTGEAPTTTWAPGPGAAGTGVDDTYADVQKIQFIGNFAYISAYGLASYIMGPWYCDPANPFLEWPLAQTPPARFPFVPDVSGCTNTGFDAIGLWVNGTAIYSMLDSHYYDVSLDPDGVDGVKDVAGQSVDRLSGSLGMWNRDAWHSEEATFDPAKFHIANGQYHAHASPLYLRAQVGDNVDVTYTATGEIDTVREAATPTQHSPILGWAFDGHPIYGPYGYSEPMNPASGIRRMRSGYVQRTGDYGTTDVRAQAGKTGRTTLPTWKRLELGLGSSSLDPDDYGPRTDHEIDDTACNPIDFTVGRYAEDNAFLGHLWNPLRDEFYQQGVDFDLDLHNGRCCVTPEFPNGTYAYFVTIDGEGRPAFPYAVGWEFCGQKLGGEEAALPGFVFTHFEASHPRLFPIPPDAATLTLRWSSREGGTYRVLGSSNLQDWTPLSPSLPSQGTTSSYTYEPAEPRPPQQFFQVILEKDGGAPQPAR